jgi:hypothetical protein
MTNNTVFIDRDEIKQEDGVSGLFNHSTSAIMYSFSPFSETVKGIELPARSPVTFPVGTVYIKGIDASCEVEIVKE